MPSGTVLNLNHPEVRVRGPLGRQSRLNLLIRTTGKLGPDAVEGGAQVGVPAEDPAVVDLASVIEFTEQHGLARQKTPERIEIVEALPKTPSGKIRKDQLRKRLWPQ